MRIGNMNVHSPRNLTEQVFGVELSHYKNASRDLINYFNFISNISFASYKKHANAAWCNVRLVCICLEYPIQCRGSRTAELKTRLCERTLHVMESFHLFLLILHGTSRAINFHRLRFAINPAKLIDQIFTDKSIMSRLLNTEKWFRFLLSTTRLYAQYIIDN